MKIRSLCLLAAVAAFAVVHADPPQYTVVILHPDALADSEGFGIGGGQQVGQAKWNGLLDDNRYATLWSGTPASAVNLNPTGVLASTAAATDGTYQVGSTLFLAQGGGENGNAAMWHGTAASYINMSPPNSSRSFMSGISNGIECGGATINDNDYSGYWTGTNPASFTMLPAPLNSSQVLGISGNMIVGEVDSGFFHAYVWNIGTHVNTDLHPAGWDGSVLTGTDGVQHVGQVFLKTDFNPLAGVWDATTGTFTLLHPGGGFNESFATGVHGGIQVGYVHGFDQTVGNFDRAAIWHGTAASYQDLQQLLPNTYIDSYASGIDAQGNIVGWGQDSAAAKNKALMWVPLEQNPPPYTFLGFFSPLNDPASPESSFKGQRTLPIKFSLEMDGLPVISATCTISLDKLDGNTVTPIDVSVFGKTANFRFDGESGVYAYSLDTKNLVPGRYRVTVTVAETGQTHSDTFTLSGKK